MIIHRIEHLEFGFGPLCTDACNLHRRTWFDITRHHNSVDESFPELIPHGVNQEIHRFGMISEETLVGLLYEYAVEDLEESGFAYYTIEVQDEHCIVFPDSQVIFDHTKATVLNIEDISSKFSKEC